MQLKPSPQFLRYNLGGALGAGLDYGLFLVFASIVPVYAARVLAQIFCISCLYFFHRRFTFQQTGAPHFREYAAFAGTQLFAASLNFLVFCLIYAGVDLGDEWLRKSVAFMCGVAVGLLVNYVILSRRVFRTGGGQ